MEEVKSQFNDVTEVYGFSSFFATLSIDCPLSECLLYKTSELQLVNELRQELS